MAASITETDSKVITSLRMPLAFMVVLWHTVGFGTAQVSSIAYQNGIFDTVKILFSEGLCIISVPIFFVISGYLFEAHFAEWNFGRYKDYISKKLPKLIIPYILWNILCFCVLYLSNVAADIIKHEAISTSFFDLFQEKGGLNIFAYGNKGYPIDYPLWFIRDLIIVNLLYPVLHFLTKSKVIWGGIVLIISVLFLVEGFVDILDFIPFASITFFMIGIFLKKYKQCMDILHGRNRWWKCVIGAISMITLIVCTITYNNDKILYEVVSKIFIFSTLPMVIHLTSSYLAKNSNFSFSSDVSSKSFFVFAIHAILLRYVSSGISSIANNGSPIMMLLMYFATALITFAISIFIFKISKITFPKTTSVLTGGRL